MTKDQHQLPPPYPTPQPSFDGPGARSIIDQPGSSSVTTSTLSSSSSYLTSPTLEIPNTSSYSQMMQVKADPGSISPDERPNTASSTVSPNATTAIKRVGGKANVSSACAPCKKAHLACDVARPCKRCVNMGKEDLCEDVPHKKRGRPKVPKPSLGEPYQRGFRPGTSSESTLNTGGSGRWRGPSGSDLPYMGNSDYGPLHSSPSLPIPFSMTNNAGPVSPSSKPDLFELFTTTDFKILRATPTCFPLTGFHPHEYVNISLADYVHPSDRQLLEVERSRLINASFPNGFPQSNRDTQAAITQLSERELLTPAPGMREPYPNQNVRILRSDHSFDWYNVRLHLGGGLGASLWRGDTLGKIYLVISLLLLRPPPDFAGEDPSRRPIASIAPLVPPTPVTAAQPGGLPSFSSFAAAAEAPRVTTPQYPPQPPTQPQSYYPSFSRPPPPILPIYSQPPMAPRRSTSPGAHRIPTTAYPDYQQQHQPSSFPPMYYSDSRESYRRPNADGMSDDDWRTRSNQSSISAGTPAQSQQLPPPGPAQVADYSRRAWEL